MRSQENGWRLSGGPRYVSAFEVEDQQLSDGDTSCCGEI